MDYLDFVEDYKEVKEINLFEKIMVASKRASDLHGNTTVAFKNKMNLKPVSSAIYEINKGYIQPDIKTKEEVEAIKDFMDGDSFEEDHEEEITLDS